MTPYSFVPFIPVQPVDIYDITGQYSINWKFLNDDCRWFYDLSHYKGFLRLINMVKMALKEFSTLYVFEGLTEEQIKSISSLLEIRHYANQDVIFEQGQTADYLFILKEGEVAIRYKPYDGPPITVSVISSGGVFGWSTALGRDCYTSSAIAQADCELLCISGSQLKCFCREDNETGIILLDRLAGVIAERLNQTHTQILSILTKGSNCQEEG